MEYLRGATSFDPNDLEELRFPHIETRSELERLTRKIHFINSDIRSGFDGNRAVNGPISFSGVDVSRASICTI